MDKIIVSAKTYDEAVTKALIELGTSTENTKITTLQEGSKGFFGLGAKPFKIQAERIRKTDDFEEVKKVVKLDTTQIKKALNTTNHTTQNISKKPEIKNESVKKQVKEQEQKENTSKESLSSDTISQKEIVKEKPKKNFEKKHIKSTPIYTEKAKSKPKEEIELLNHKESIREEMIRAGIIKPNQNKIEKEVNIEEIPEETKEILVVEMNEEEKSVLILQAKEFLNQIFTAMEMEIYYDVNFIENEMTLLLLSEREIGILIGKRGQTLDALQYLTSLVVNKISSSYVRVKLDAQDYRNKRKEKLESLAKSIAQKVRKFKKPISLEPMNPYERRIIHSTLQGHPQVTTRSEGEEQFRHVVVIPRYSYNKKNEHRSYKPKKSGGYREQKSNFRSRKNKDGRYEHQNKEEA